ncbi:MAG TPA: ABC transporter ATP-binding protein [Candidatus Limnocylindrales bacterium]
MADAITIRTEGLTKRYRSDRSPALDRVDLAVGSGASVALVGPNGAGKSTLIRTFLGFERPTAGRALVADIDPQRDRPAALRRIGYVGQDPGLYRDLSVADHVAYAGALRADFDGALALERFDRLGIDRDERVGELSGGQQAQVALGLALGTRAPILLLDEPLASLDPLARRDFLSAVRAVADGGTTILFASHIVGDLEAACDRLVILASGRIMLHESIDAIRAGHALVDLDAAPTDGVIGVFDDRAGRAQALIRVDAPEPEPPALDDVVLGYLAAALGRRSGEGRAA